MGKINLLDKRTAELIAAGEVIERPASVIKELVENSLDAGASSVTVEIQRGGISYMRVTDDGCGMASDDLPKAFLRHATSKVLTAEDLASIGTLGFRGEALASVGAVAEVTLLSRTPECDCGASYLFDRGEGGGLTEAGCPAGTTVVVKDLFRNVPARLKFLKKDSTEGAAIAALMERLALSHPEVSFRLISEGKEKLHTPGDGRLLSAVHAACGAAFAASLTPVSFTKEGISLDGFITRPEQCRPTRGMQFYYINGRYIRSGTMLAAVEESYRNSVMTGRFPGCVLMLTIPCGMVDVNVHPAKLEVKLSDEKRVFELVSGGCRAALYSMGNRTRAADTAAGRSKLNYYDIYNHPGEAVQQRIPEGKNGDPPRRMSAEQYLSFVSGGKKPEQNAEPEAFVPPRHPKKLEDPAQPSAGSFSPAGTPQKTENVEARAEKTFAGRTPVMAAAPAGASELRTDTAELLYGAEAARKGREAAQKPLSSYLEDADAAAEKEAARSERGSGSLSRHAGAEERRRDADTGLPEDGVAVSGGTEAGPRYIGEAFHTYILAECGGEFLMIDKHAGHERVLFNRLKAELADSAVPRQLLLAPEKLTLSHEGHAAVLQELDALERAGFLVEDFGGSDVILREIPAVCGIEEASSALEEIAEGLASGSGGAEGLYDDLLHSIACKAAIKGSARSDPEELVSLMEEILCDPAVRTCPHGRPVVISFTRREIEKMFGRIV